MQPMALELESLKVYYELQILVLHVEHGSEKSLLIKEI
jgi:hypothetical protein